MPKDQNISLEYGGVCFEPALVNFMEYALRVGMSLSHRSGMHLVQNYMSLLAAAPDENIAVAYSAKRSTYGKKQHLNIYEEFTAMINGQRRFKFYSEYANDPHHRIDAGHNHTIIAEPTPLLTAIYKNSSYAALNELTRELMILADDVSIIQSEETIVGFWFDHEHGSSVIGLNLTAEKKG